MVLAGFALALAACSGSTRLGEGAQSTAGRPVALVPRQADAGAPADRGASAPLDEAELRKAIERYRITKDRRPSPVQVAGFDLSGDGQPEALVLYTGADWCTKTGCSFVVFQPSKYGYRPISHSVRVRGPIRIGPGSNYGWRDLIVKTGGGPSPIRFVRLGFTGNGYPQNALLEPQPTEDVLARSVEVIPETPFDAGVAQSSGTR